MHFELWEKWAKRLVEIQKSQDSALFVIVPDYGVVRPLSEAIFQAQQAHAQAALLPRFLTFTDLYLQLKLVDAEPELWVNSMEARVSMAYILQQVGKPMSMVEDYVKNALQPNQNANIQDVLVLHSQELSKHTMGLPKNMDEDLIIWMLSHEYMQDKYIVVIPSIYQVEMLVSYSQSNLEILIEEQPLAITSDAQIARMHTKGQAVRFLLNQIYHNPEVQIISHDGTINDMLMQAILSRGYKIVHTHEFKLFLTLAQLQITGLELDALIAILRSPIAHFMDDAGYLSLLEGSSNENFAHPLEELISRLSETDLGKSLISMLRRPVADTLSGLLTQLQILWNEVVDCSLSLHLNAFNAWIQELYTVLKRWDISVQNDSAELLCCLASCASISDEVGMKIGSIYKAESYYNKSIILLENGLATLEKNAIEIGGNELKLLFGSLDRILSCAEDAIIVRVEDGELNDSIYVNNLMQKSLLQQVQCCDAMAEYNPQYRKQPSVYVSPHQRPLKYWVTDITKLLHDPYCFYLSKILGINQKGQIWDDIEDKVFGMVVHEVLSQLPLRVEFLNQSNIVDNAIRRYNLPSRMCEIWRNKLHAICLFISEYHANCHYDKVEAEQRIASSLALEDAQEVQIMARADRIEYAADGGCIVVDYKTGYIPTANEVKQGIAPQLAIEGWIMHQRGYLSEQGRYIGISGRKDSHKIQNITLMHDVTQCSLMILLERFIMQGEDYFTPCTPLNQWRSAYAHLLRRETWY